MHKDRPLQKIQDDAISEQRQKHVHPSDRLTQLNSDIQKYKSRSHSV